MLPVSKEVLNFVRACEVLHGRLAHGDPLTPEELGQIPTEDGKLTFSGPSDSSLN